MTCLALGGGIHPFSKMPAPSAWSLLPWFVLHRPAVPIQERVGLSESPVGCLMFGRRGDSRDKSDSTGKQIRRWHQCVFTHRGRTQLAPGSSTSGYGRSPRPTPSWGAGILVLYPGSARVRPPGVPHASLHPSQPCVRGTGLHRWRVDSWPCPLASGQVGHWESLAEAGEGEAEELVPAPPWRQSSSSTQVGCPTAAALSCSGNPSPATLVWGRRAPHPLLPALGVLGRAPPPRLWFLFSLFTPVTIVPFNKCAQTPPSAWAVSSLAIGTLLGGVSVLGEVAGQRRYETAVSLTV